MSLSPTLSRIISAFIALGVAFLGALLVINQNSLGWLFIALGLPLSALGALAGDALGTDFTKVVQHRATQLIQNTRPWMWFVAFYAALKIPVPLWPEGFPILGLASTAALFAGALAYVWENENGIKALLMAIVAFGVGLGIEMLGSQTGFPFGQYSYETAPAPILLGVPLIVPLGWFALTLAATLLARGSAPLAGLLLAFWDVGLEPLMTAQKYWLWSDPAPLWAGAPLQNFIGWWAVGTFLAWLFVRIGLQNSLQHTHVTWTKSFAVAFAIESFFLPGGLLLVGRPFEALVTLIFMLLGLFLAKYRRRY